MFGGKKRNKKEGKKKKKKKKGAFSDQRPAFSRLRDNMKRSRDPYGAVRPKAVSATAASFWSRIRPRESRTCSPGRLEAHGRPPRVDREDSHGSADDRGWLKGPARGDESAYAYEAADGLFELLARRVFLSSATGAQLFGPFEKFERHRRSQGAGINRRGPGA